MVNQVVSNMIMVIFIGLSAYIVLLLFQASNKLRRKYTRGDIRSKITLDNVSTKNVKVETRVATSKINLSGTHTNKLQEACTVCGKASSVYGDPVSCSNPNCNRWYHPKCLSWIKSRGRVKCSCGHQLPGG